MKTVKHITVVTSYFYPKIGGLENYAYQLAKGLRESGEYEVSIITSHYDGHGYKREVVDGMTVHRLPIWFKVSNTPFNFLWYWQIKKIFAAEGTDMVHIHAPVVFMADLAAWASGDRPVVLTYHSGSMRKGAWPADIVVGFYENLLLPMLFRRANAVVAISQDFAKRKFPQFINKISFIPTGVDLARFKKIPLPASTEIVTYVGRIEHNSSWKGIDQLLQAMALVVRHRPQSKLEVVGGGDAIEHYRARAQELGIGQSVVFPGPQINEKLVEVYRRSSVVVLPSTSDSEAFSVALLEAMASGRPIIGTSIGGTPQVITDGENGLLVPPKDPEALAKAIERILGDKQLATWLADSGAAKAQGFSWDIQTKKYIELFKKLGQHTYTTITFIVSGSVRSNFTYRALSLAKSLQKLGHEVSIIAPNADKYNDFKPETIHSIDGVKIIQPFQFTTKHLEVNLLPYIFNATKAVLRKKTDLVYLYKPTPISIVGFAAKFFRGTPVILDMDDLGSEVMRIEGHPWYQRELTAWCERFAAKHADRIVVASTYLADKYHKEFPGKPIHIMPNGVEVDWFTPVIPSEEKKRVVFLGAINRKNILGPLFDVFPQVLKEHSDAKLLIIGDGQFLSYFKERAKKSGIEKNVIFTGWLSLNEAHAHLFAGDIGYSYMPDSPVTRAANNMKVSQYMARGVVPLVSNLDDLVVSIDSGTAGYIAKADNLESLQKTLALALTDMDRMGKAEHARASALRKFNWDNLGEKFDAWIKPGSKGSKEKIYMVSPGLPGNFGGGEIRNYNLIKQLVSVAGANVEVFCVASGDLDTARDRFEADVHARCHLVPSQPRSITTALGALLERISPFMYEFKTSGIGDVFRKACERSLPDVVQIQQMQAYYAIRPHVPWLKSHGVKIVLDCHNIEFRSFGEWLEVLPWPQKIAGKFLAPNLKKIETDAARESDMVFACSESDADFFRQYNPNTHVIPNGVDCSEFQPVEKKQNAVPALIFMGGVKYPPNADALQFYLSDIHPKIKERLPDVVMLAIGADKGWLNSVGLNNPSVKPLGFVEDVRPYLTQADIGICPVRYGSGTRIKIMTYMAAGLPVVSTAKGAEGVTYTNGHDIIITDDPKEFANAILKLFNDPAYRDRIARNGREFILKNYDWNVIGEKLAHAYEHDLR